LSEKEKQQYVAGKKTAKTATKRGADEKSQDQPPECDCPPAKKKSQTRKRRGMTGFIAFSNEHREEVKKEHPTASFGELGKRLGKMWRALSDEEKQKYTK
jgi:hypothetical protein